MVTVFSKFLKDSLHEVHVAAFNIKYLILTKFKHIRKYFGFKISVKTPL